MGIELLLEPATNEEKDLAVRDFITAKHFAGQGYALFFGSKGIGDNKNQFWYNPRHHKYYFDYQSNFLGNLNGPLQILTNVGTSVSGQNTEENKPIYAAIKSLQLYLEEDLQMFEQGKISVNGRSLNAKNKEILGHLKGLKERVSALDEGQIGTPDFAAKAGELARYYRKEVKPLYMDRLLKLER